MVDSGPHWSKSGSEMPVEEMVATTWKSGSMVMSSG